MESTNTSTSDESEDEPEEIGDNDILQSPKMVIQEQMDKVVTRLDGAYHTTNDISINHLGNKLDNLNLDLQPKNDTQSQSDGSTLLDRVLPEQVSSTTIAKETFTIRPIDASFDSLWMQVIKNNDTCEKEDSDQHLQQYGKDTTTDDDSIFLDIAGYKSEQHHSTSTDILSSAKTDHHTIINTGLSHEQESSHGDHSWGHSCKDGESSSHGTTARFELLAQPGQVYRIQLSLCGFSAFGSNDSDNVLVFRQHQISYGTFIQTPDILNDKNLVIKYNNRYYGSGCSGLFFTSLLVFQTPADDVDQGLNNDDPTTKGTWRFGRGWRQWLNRSSIQAVETTMTTGPGNNTHHTTYTTTTKATTFGSVNDVMDDQQQSGDNSKGSTPAVLNTSKDIFSNQQHQRRHFAKTLRLTSDQLKSLPLKKGVNTISFSVTSAYQGTATCVAKLFLWDANIKVVISDIDGTITKSDALGHVFTMIGKDWTHDGVAKLYTNVHHNGYQFLYLTSRAIGQADYTRDYLKRVVQDDYQLPDGPVLMSPDRLFTSFHREVIIRKPEVFKMGCLRDVRQLFGNNKHPFYAGFGNRITDGVSYRSVDVPTSRIFTIDPQGKVKLELLLGFSSSYVDLGGLVDHMFPPLAGIQQDQRFNDWNYWKAPLPIIDLPTPITKTKIDGGAKPIVPDISSLPKESVIDTSIRQRRSTNILRRLTSRSSLRSTTSSLTNSLPKLKHSNLSITTSHSTPITALEKVPVKSLSFELLDDDAFDATLDALEDEIDMDSIPFL
ncbi:Lipin/Ned1/Smp2-domain-containing protein [Chlamydoabsidia padenii]|nr:Lipin/Ned1/Smp2-domain-containing protein [Chlamydoabsidia padenii]